MTRQESATFLARTQGLACVSFERRADGSMVNRSRWSGLAQRWQALRRGAWALLALVAPFSFTACSNPEGQRTGGKICVAPVGNDSGITHRDAKDSPETSRMPGTPLPPTGQ